MLRAIWDWHKSVACFHLYAYHDERPQTTVVVEESRTPWGYRDNEDDDGQ